jgi:thioredoxin reductase (NADPH)
MDLMRTQAERFGAVFQMENVVSVDVESRPIVVTTDNKKFECDAVVIASGASAMQIGLDSERELQGFGVSYCATCDGFFFKGKQIAVVGGGDSAMEEATFLTKFADKVTIIHRRQEFRASKIMLQRAIDNPKVEFLYDTVVEEVIGSKETGVTSLKIRNAKTDQVTDFPAQGLFVAIGHTPNTKPFEGKLEMDDKGYIITKPDSSLTSVEGVFACGDAMDHVYRQAVTAAGTGCRAALDCERWLAEKGIH